MELVYDRKDGELEPGVYLVDVCEYRPMVRYHIQAKVIGKVDKDLDEAYERYSNGGPYEKVLTYLSKQEMARSWKEIGE
jgi:hypothetical protein